MKHKHLLDTPKNTTKAIIELTVSGGCLRPVERADDDEAEAFALLSIDDNIAGLSVGGRRPVWGGRVARAGVGRLGSAGAVAICEVTARGAVLRGDGARAAAILRTGLTCKGRQRAELLRAFTDRKWRKKYSDPFGSVWKLSGGREVRKVMGYCNYYFCTEQKVQKYKQNEEKWHLWWI